MNARSTLNAGLDSAGALMEGAGALFDRLDTEQVTDRVSDLVSELSSLEIAAAATAAARSVGDQVTAAGEHVVAASRQRRLDRTKLIIIAAIVGAMAATGLVVWRRRRSAHDEASVEAQDRFGAASPN